MNRYAVLEKMDPRNQCEDDEHFAARVCTVLSPQSASAPPAGEPTRPATVTFAWAVMANIGRVERGKRGAFHGFL